MVHTLHGHRDSILSLHILGTGAPPREAGAHRPARGSAAGLHAAALSRDGVVFVWRLSDGQRVAEASWKRGRGRGGGAAGGAAGKVALPRQGLALPSSDGPPPTRILSAHMGFARWATLFPHAPKAQRGTSHAPAHLSCETPSWADTACTGRFRPRPLRQVDSGLASTQAEPTRITCIAPCQRPTRFLAGDRSCQVAEWDWPTRTRLRSVRLRFMDPIRRFGLVDISTGLAEPPTCGSPTKLCYHPPTDTVTVGFSRGPVQLLFWDSDAPAADAARPPRALLHTLGSDL